MGFLGKDSQVYNDSVIENTFFHIPGLGIDELSFSRWQNFKKPKIPALAIMEMR